MAINDMNYAAQIDIPDYVFMSNRTDYVEHAIECMKRDGAIKIFDQIYESDTPMVVETHLETWADPFEGRTCYRLHYRLTKVRTMDYVMMPEIPPFTFVDHEGKIEWKCPACGTINGIDATYCGELHKHAVGCGHPREKTRQEML